jgi:acyl-CoA reductase-like NAD-dependent aldehyde dehydrogenase
MQIINPATEQLIAELPEDDARAVSDKVARARAAQPAWAAAPLPERLDAITRFRAALAAQNEDLARTLTREMGKPISQSRNELSAMAGRLDFFLRETAAVLGDEVVLVEASGGPVPKLEERIAHEPLGVVANVSAWNYPYFVGSNVFVPALLTGNTVVYKPSEHATQTGLSIARLLHEAGVPEDAFATVIGAGAAGRALIEAPVDGVFFTGSYATGRKIAEAVSGRLVKVQLELGGKDPVYVCDDLGDASAIAAAAAGLADGAMYNAGQSCCAVERLYVHEAIARPFLDAFVAAVRGFVVGDPEDEATYLGPLARKEQLAVLDAQVADAVAKGARILCGGARGGGPGGASGRGYYYAPTVLADVTHEMAVMREETFGPVIGIQVVRDDAEAVRLMNDTEYGLTAGVYSKSRDRAQALLRQVNAGSVYWNCCDRVSPRLPWTGRKHSGQGSTLSTHGIRTFLQPKAWHLRAPG